MKVHLDTDLGGDIDDLCALALLLKWPDVEITGITIEGDDKGKRAGFTKYALKVAGKENIPVMAGSDISLGCYRIFLGCQGKDYWPQDLPPVNNSPDEALDLLKKSVDDGAIIVAIGPLTNLYLLEQKFPGILLKAKLYLMGGYIYPPRKGYPQWKQNFDFNLQVDITSAKYVLEHSQPTLIPVTLTVETYLRRTYLEDLKKADNLCKLIAKQAEAFAIDEKYEEKYGKTCPKLPKDIINFQHDPLTVAIALGWNEGIEFKDLPLKLSIKDTWMYETIDSVSKKIYRVVTKVDGEKFSQDWLKIVTS